MFDQSIIVRVRYSSGQRGQTVNLLTMSSVVRIHVSPPLALVFCTSCYAGLAQLARASAFQAEGCGFESRFPLHSCIFPFQSSFFLSKHVPWATTQGLMRAVARNREQAFETMLKVESTVTATNFILRETYNGQGKIRTQKAPR